MNRQRLAAIVILAAIVPALAGCAASSRVDPADLTAVPDDFTLDVSVIRGRDVGEQHGAHLQPMRYVLLPDGTLRSGAVSTLPVADSDSLPGVTRVLTRQQMESLWILIREAGLADRTRREPPTNMALFVAPADRMMYLAQFQAVDVNWSASGPAPIVPTEGADPAASTSPALGDSISSIDPTLTTLVKRLAALAWVSDEPASARRPAPIRYDFGPDPYARYRTP